MNSIYNHPEVKKYVQKMIEQGRCQQCISITGKGICSCPREKRLDPEVTTEYVSIMQFMKKLRKEGWEW